MHLGGACIIFSPYTLYYIISVGGHYFNYIYDYSDNKWRKYSDVLIEEVDEEQVLQEAYGINYIFIT